MKNIEQFKGLTTEEVNGRKKQGKVNIKEEVTTKSIGKIYSDNILTLFNLINIILFLLLLIVGSFKNMLFMGVVVANTAIGIIQEIRSKIAADNLSIMVASKAQVRRNGETVKIPVEDIVIDDILILSNGDQIPSDATVISGSCFVNESLLTGESMSVEKTQGSEVLSGSFVSSGKCIVKVTRVGKDNFVSKINKEAKYIKNINSEIMRTTKLIIKINSIIIIPLGIALFYNQFTLGPEIIYSMATFKSAVVGTVAALIGMIPEGLVLLTSTVLAVSVIRLSKSKVLIQEMHCIETLARVDVLCLDKTGTITCDEMIVQDVVPIKNSNMDELNLALSTIAEESIDDSPTINCIKSYYKNYNFKKIKEFVPFSSDQKWSGVILEDGTSYVLGAGEYILNDTEYYNITKTKLDDYQSKYRTLTVVKVNEEIKANHIFTDVEPLGFILIKDKIRKNARKTINYFKEQGVALKVISGDNVNTVKNIAEIAGIDTAEIAIDASTLNTDEKIYEAAEKYTIFGRTTPEIKLKLIKALKAQGHSVAMTGDGVNDVLALKEADCSVAMAAGSEAARNVSQIVLVNNDFSSMPKIVAEGRRAINNIQRSASLFLVKTIFSMILSIIFIFISSPYPFEPIQLSLISTFTIGLPSFVLAMEPNFSRVTGRFFFNIITEALPCAIVMVVNILLAVLAGNIFSLSKMEVSTIAVFLTALSGVLQIIRISKPFTILRGILLFVVSGCLILGFTRYRHFFLLGFESMKAYVILVLLTAAAVFMFKYLYDFSYFVINKFSKKKVQVKNIF